MAHKLNSTSNTLTRQRTMNRHAAWLLAAAAIALPLTLGGCPPMDDTQSGQDAPAVPGPQGEMGLQGGTGLQGDMGLQGSPGASPFTLMGLDAFYTQGNVGIGTDTPSATLDVVGDAEVTGDLFVDGTIFADAISSNSSLQLQTAGTTRIFVDDATGNVGIGTTTPSATLDVNGTTELNGDVTINSNLSVDTDALFVDGAARRVGIGTNTPTEALDVAGTVAADRFLGDGSGLSGVSRVGSTVDLNNVAMLRWDLLNRSFPVGDAPQGVAFDGTNIWVANVSSDNVTKLRASDGANLGTFPVARPFGVAFDGANIWVANGNSNNVTRISLVK